MSYDQLPHNISLGQPKRVATARENFVRQLSRRSRDRRGTPLGNGARL